MNKNFLPYDIYERHRFIGEYIEDGKTVLDVGGEMNHLSQFCKPSKIVVANLNTGDVVIKKGKLPFKNLSFDVACAIDVLEHIKKDERKEFIGEVIRVSKDMAILSFPIATPDHVKYELETEKWLEGKGLDVTYLKEHIKNGLPEVSEIKQILGSRNYGFVYSGQTQINKFLFRIFIFDPKIKYIRKIIYYKKLIFNFLTNPLLYLLLVNKKYKKDVNRGYLVIKLK